MDIPIILVENEGLPEGTIRFAEFAEDFNLDTSCLKSVKRGPKDLAILPFSSGTTGFPKAVALNHASVLAMNQQIIDPEIVVCKETTGKFSKYVAFSISVAFSCYYPVAKRSMGLTFKKSIPRKLSLSISFHHKIRCLETLIRFSENDQIV